MSSLKNYVRIIVLYLIRNWADFVNGNSDDFPKGRILILCNIVSFASSTKMQKVIAHSNSFFNFYSERYFISSHASRSYLETDRFLVTSIRILVKYHTLTRLLSLYLHTLWIFYEIFLKKFTKSMNVNNMKSYIYFFLSVLKINPIKRFPSK